MPRYDRKKFFVDSKVQGALLMRATAYWLFWILTVLIMLVSWRILSGPANMFTQHLDEVWYRYAPAVVASCLLLPLVLADLARLSNRFAGPMVRLRRSMRALARGEEVQSLHFRKNDFWQEITEDFNAVVARVQSGSVTEEELQPSPETTTH